MSGRKVLMLGLDGATLELVKPWVEDGELPTFSRLLHGGVHAECISTIPFTSLPAWTSIITGRNPGKHGIFDFLTFAKNGPRVMTSRDRRGPAIWNILNEHGRKTVVINMPGTYPVESVDGVMISGFPAPEGRKDFVYPEALMDDLIREDYQVECPDLYARVADKNRVLGEILNVTEKRAKVALRIMRLTDWDFFAVVFTELDRIQHFFWEDKNAILWYYKRLDGIVRRFLEDIDWETTSLIVVSDHGFGSLARDFNVNNLLCSMGLLKWQDESKKYLEMIVDLLAGRILPLLSRFNLLFLVDMVKFFVTPDFTDSRIDFCRTKVWCPSLSGQGLMINRAGKNARATQEPGESEQTMEQVVRALKMLKDPENGCHPVERVYRKEEIYSGPHASKGLDILVSMHKGYAMQPMASSRGFFTKPKLCLGVARSGDHRPEGMFIAYGRNMKQGWKLDRVSVYDVVPTILDILDIPIPSDVDGMVLKDIFIKTSELANRPVQFSDGENEKDRIRLAIRRLAKPIRGRVNDENRNSN